MLDPLSPADEFHFNWFGGAVVGVALAASLLGSFCLYQLAPKRAPEPLENRELEGLKGWLILFMVGMALRLFAYGKSAYVASSIICDWGKWHSLTGMGSARYNAFWAPSLLFEACGSVIVVVASVLAFILMFEKKFTFPFVMIGIMLASLIFHIVDHLLASQISALSKDIPTFFTQMFRLIVYASVWIPYLLVSKRVKTTFRY